MKNLIFIILVILFSQSNSFSQIDSTLQSPKFKHSVGFALGMTTGYGLSYRYNLNKFEFQIAFAPVKTSYETRINTGLTIFYKLVETKYTYFFIYQGNSYLYTKGMDYLYDNAQTEPKEEITEHHEFNNGICIGIRFIILSRVGLQFMAGYASLNNFQEINFTGETGVYFRF